MALEKVKVGSVDYQIPKPITKERSEFDGMYIKKCRNDFFRYLVQKSCNHIFKIITFVGMRWIINAARDRDKAKSRFNHKLAEVLVETASFTGRVIQVKNDHHKTCEVNRAFAHYRRTK